MKNHPNRKELIGDARDRSGIFNVHLNSCVWCGIYSELLKIYQFAGSLPLVEPPNNWSERAIAVAKTGLGKKLKSLAANLTFDSWAMPLPAGVRGEGIMQERRVRFEISDKTLDLRAEHRSNRWDFVARITDSSGETVDCTLLAGKKELNINEDGFYQWSSVRPPVRFKLQTEDGDFETPELSWKK